MPVFSRKSKAILGTVHVDLQSLFNSVVVDFDCTPLCGFRTEKEQADLYAIGRTVNIGQPTVTTLDGVTKKSKHQTGLALDIVPYPINWNDLDRFYYFAGFVKARSIDMGIEVRWGGDWDGDTVLSDNKFNDLPHWELVT